MVTNNKSIEIFKILKSILLLVQTLYNKGMYVCLSVNDQCTNSRTHLDTPVGLRTYNLLIILLFYKSPFN